MAFTNRCFPSKIVPIWKKPFSDVNHIKIVGTYFRCSGNGNWEDLVCIDVSPLNMPTDPMLIVQARKKLTLLS